MNEFATVLELSNGKKHGLTFAGRTKAGPATEGLRNFFYSCSPATSTPREPEPGRIKFYTAALEAASIWCWGAAPKTVSCRRTRDGLPPVAHHLDQTTVKGSHIVLLHPLRRNDFSIEPWCLELKVSATHATIYCHRSAPFESRPPQEPSFGVVRVESCSCQFPTSVSQAAWPIFTSR